MSCTNQSPLGHGKAVMDILAQIDEDHLILLAEKKAQLCGGTSVHSRCRYSSVGVALSICEQIESCRSETKKLACCHMAMMMMMHFPTDHW